MGYSPKISLILSIVFVNLLTLLVLLVREYYIIYHHIYTYFLVSLAIFIVTSLGVVFYWRHSGITCTCIPWVIGTSLFLAIPISFYPNTVNNPDVIKMLQLTSFLMSKNFELARHIDYSAFPGFSYILGIISVTVGMSINIKLASLVYILFSFVLLLVVFALGMKSKQPSMYMLILFSLGFIYSFNYLSPQMLGQILLVTSLIALLNTNLSFMARFVVWSISYIGVLLIHPESMIMLFLIFIFYFIVFSLTLEKQKRPVMMLTSIILFSILTTVYLIFFVPSNGPEYILKAPLAYFMELKNVVFHLFTHGKDSVVTSSTIKPSNILIFSKINLTYNLILLVFVIYLLIKYTNMYLEYGILMLSFMTSAIAFVAIFGLSFGQFIGRPAFAVSLVVSIVLTKYLNTRRARAILGVTLIALLFMLISFPARVAPQEWNVHAQNYYPPIDFIIDHHTQKQRDIYYFLYPNPGISIQKAEYVILPIGQKEYVIGMSNFFGWNAQKAMKQIMLSYEYQGIIYTNTKSLTMWKCVSSSFIRR
ncbi:hypothetical protein [Thermococcus sp. 21S7]|uniref:hypothetical protein n=1 Tax=Thermococcus sp. 21S7 TaxID=1638221 RepID=UPI00143B2691|nr:hypothetical protein [Thermococcus sp. 21S7]NJE62096.1 hypothetical protein [Thermococcus sp. 21S7]